jgi:phenylacetic acid degradation protein PaaD
MQDVDDRIRHLAAHDVYTRDLGIELVEARLGHVVVKLTVGPQHLNFNGTCHGSVVFSLADTALALASNSHGAVAPAIDAHIAYPAPAHAGDELTATATELTRSPQLAVYRVDVKRTDGTLVGALSGTVYVTKRKHEP